LTVTEFAGHKFFFDLNTLQNRPIHTDIATGMSYLNERDEEEEGTWTEEGWKKMFRELQKFEGEHGNGKVPNRRIKGRYLALSKWVKEQRRHRYNMPEKNRRKLDKLGFKWISFQEEQTMERWHANYECLKNFKAENGHCQVPRHYEDNLQLGLWVSKQRSKRHKISPERKRLLDQIGFTWVVTKRDSWDEMYERLVQYREHTGNCLVPQIYNPDPKLGKWVSAQRQIKHKISSERALQLDAINFKWQRNTAWDDMFDRLKAFCQERGHCLVPHNYKEDIKLGRWVSMQRYRKDTMNPERVKHLNSIGFAWQYNGRKNP
jgi:hypothetical protein